MPKTTITVPGYMNRPWDVTGYLEAGLFVHKMGKTWSVMHAATGMHVGTSRRTKAEALTLAKQLRALGVDWTRDTLEGIADSGGRSVREFSDTVRAFAYA